MFSRRRRRFIRTGLFGFGEVSDTEQLRQLLFSSSEQGGMYESRPVVDGVQVLWQDAAGTVPVDADGQVIGRRVDISGNTVHFSQGTAGAKPIYRTDGTLHWIEYDRVDDKLSASIDLNGSRWSAVNYYGATIGDFLLAHRGGLNPWSGIGQQGSGTTTLSGQGAVQNGFYVDGVLSTATTRGGQFTDADAGNVAETDFSVTTTWSTLATGKYDGVDISAPGRDYGYIVRSPQFTQAERDEVVAYGKQRAGV